MLRLSVISLLLSSVSFGSVLTFTDYSAWNQAANALPSTAILHGLDTPGLTFTTISGMGPGRPYPGNGHREGNVWVDEVGKITSTDNYYDSTTISYPGFYGIFANWNVQPSYSSGLEIYAMSDTSVVMMHPFGGDMTSNADFRDGYMGGWGFLSDQPISSVILGSSLGGVMFNFIDLSVANGPVAATPEPCTVMLLGIALIGLSGFRYLSSIRSIL